MSEEAAFRRLVTNNYHSTINGQTDAATLKTLLQTTNAQWILDLAAAKSVFDYEGFDPSYMIGALVTKCGQNADDKKALSTFMMAASVLVTFRGTNYEKIVAHSSDSLVDTLESWRARWNLTTKKPRGGYKKTHVTLARVANCFPIYSSLAMMHKKACPVPNELIADIPWSMRTTNFGGMIPSGNAYEQLKVVHLRYLVEFDKIIHRKDGKTTPEADIRKFQEAAINSTFNSDAVRQGWLVQVGLVVGDQLNWDVNGTTEPRPAQAGNAGAAPPQQN